MKVMMLNSDSDADTLIASTGLQIASSGTRTTVVAVY